MTIVSLQPPDVKVLMSKPVCLISSGLNSSFLVLEPKPPLALNTSFLINFSRESVQKGESNQGKKLLLYCLLPSNVFLSLNVYKTTTHKNNIHKYRGVVLSFESKKKKKMQQKTEKVCVDEGCGNLEYFCSREKYEQWWVNNGLVLPPCVDIYSLL